MVGFRWVGCLALLALACGRTANSDMDAARAGSPPAVGGTGSGGGAVAGGSGAVSQQAGQAGAPDCPVTPAAGQWVAIDPDPYGFELASDGSRLSGQGCLGGLAAQGNEPIVCSPLVLSADRGRRVDFVWDMRQGQNAPGIAYVVKMNLTLSPERTALAGKVWTSLGGLNGDGQEIVLVPYPGQPVPAATACSGGEPSGACFLGPLRSDAFSEPRVVELGKGNLLLLWLSQRGVGKRIAAAQFEASTHSWRPAEFLDDGSAPVDASLIAASPAGWAILVYRQNNVLWTRSYDPGTNAWSRQQLLVVGDDASSSPRPETLLVYDGGGATLIASLQAPDGSTALSAHDYVAEVRVWENTHVFAATPNVANTEWAAGSDSPRNALVVWVRGGEIGKPFEVWFSSRTPFGSWTDAAKLYTGDKQIINPAVAVGKDGTAVVTWQEWITRIASSSYSFKTGAWSEPLTVTAEQQADNRAVAFNEAGAALAYFHRNDAFHDDAEQRSELGDGVWGVPQTIPAEEANGARYAVTGGVDNLLVTPLHPGDGASAPGGLALAQCDGY